MTKKTLFQDTTPSALPVAIATPVAPPHSSGEGVIQLGEAPTSAPPYSNNGGVAPTRTVFQNNAVNMGQASNSAPIYNNDGFNWRDKKWLLFGVPVIMCIIPMVLVLVIFLVVFFTVIKKTSDMDKEWDNSSYFDD